MSDRIDELEEMGQFELLDILEQIREVVWHGEDSASVILEIKEIVGKPDDFDDQD